MQVVALRDRPVQHGAILDGVPFQDHDAIEVIRQDARGQQARNAASDDDGSLTEAGHPLGPEPGPLGLGGHVRLQEAPRVLDHLVDVLRRVLPRIDGHLGLRGEGGHFHGDLVRMRGHVVRRD